MTNVVTETSDAPPPFDEEDFKMVKRREERAAARATQRSLQSAGVAAGSSREAADPHFRKSQNEVDIQGLGPPPPFDEEDFKMAKRREEKAAARATQRSLQSAGVFPVSSCEEADLRFRQSQNEADIQGLGPPPPFDEEDFKMAKRREERAAARAARKQSSLSATSPHGIDWFA
jgi:hypothetical protein